MGAVASAEEPRPGDGKRLDTFLDLDVDQP